MKIYELANELKTENNKVTAKDIISYIKDHGYPKTTSHQQTVPDELIDEIRERFSVVKTVAVSEPVSVETEVSKPVIQDSTKVFKPDDIITCRSVTPWKVVVTGADGRTIYSWEGFGDLDYITYKDLQFLRRKEVITKPMILIEDADLCYQWRRELGDVYKYYIGVDYPEDFFELDDNKFKDLLTNAPEVIQEVIKSTAMNMIRNENYPSLQKIHLIDDTLGTCIKEFL